MTRAEKRRQKKMSAKAAKKATLKQVAPTHQTLPIQQAIDLALQHHIEGRLPEAESIYRQILTADPNQPVALHSLGMIANQLGKNNVAIDLIRKALAIKHRYPEAHINLGLIYHELGKLDEAVASYHKALDINSDFAEAHFNLGNALFDLKNFEDAIVSYHKTLSINPEIVDAYVNLGNAFYGLGKLDEAIANYHKALALEPNHRVRYNLGRLLLMVPGEYKEGLGQMRKSRGVIELKIDKGADYNILH